MRTLGSLFLGTIARSGHWSSVIENAGDAMLESSHWELARERSPVAVWEKRHHR